MQVKKTPAQRNGEEADISRFKQSLAQMTDRGNFILKEGQSVDAFFKLIVKAPNDNACREQVLRTLELSKEPVLKELVESRTLPGKLCPSWLLNVLED